MRTLEIVEEAVKNIPQEQRKYYPAIPWKDMAGIRDKLIHEYCGVKTELLWIAAKSELPPISLLCKKMLKELEE